MMKLKSKRFCRGSFKLIKAAIVHPQHHHPKTQKPNPTVCNDDIKWEVRPGGMLVQRRDSSNPFSQFITLTVSTLSLSHHISIQPTSTFGELKGVIAMATGLEPREQRVLYRGKEREDGEFLHMLGVQDKDKVFLLQDPTKLRVRPVNPTPCRAIAV